MTKDERGQAEDALTAWFESQGIAAVDAMLIMANASCTIWGELAKEAKLHLTKVDGVAVKNFFALLKRTAALYRSLDGGQVT